MLRCAEVCQLDGPVFSEEKVGAFDVSVEDVVAVYVFKALKYLFGVYSYQLLLEVMELF